MNLTIFSTGIIITHLILFALRAIFVISPCFRVARSPTDKGVLQARRWCHRVGTNLELLVGMECGYRQLTREQTSVGSCFLIVNVVRSNFLVTFDHFSYSHRLDTIFGTWKNLFFLNILLNLCCLSFSPRFYCT